MMNINEVQKRIKQRPPFQMIEKVAVFGLFHRLKTRCFVPILNRISVNDRRVTSPILMQ